MIMTREQVLKGAIFLLLLVCFLDLLLTNLLFIAVSVDELEVHSAAFLGVGIEVTASRTYTDANGVYNL